MLAINPGNVSFKATFIPNPYAGSYPKEIKVSDKDYTAKQVASAMAVVARTDWWGNVTALKEELERQNPEPPKSDLDITG